MRRSVEVGACLRAVRLASKRGLRATAQAIGVAHPTLAEWESGARPIPAAQRPAIVVVFPMLAPVFEAYDVCPACGHALLDVIGGAA